MLSPPCSHYDKTSVGLRRYQQNQAKHGHQVCKNSFFTRAKNELMDYDDELNSRNDITLIRFHRFLFVCFIENAAASLVVGIATTTHKDSKGKLKVVQISLITSLNASSYHGFCYFQ